MMGSKRRTPIGGVDGARDRRLRGRTFAVAVLLLAIAAMGVRAEAQPAARVPKVGLLLPTTAAAAGYNVEALKQGLREAGYVEGKTIALEIRYGEGDSARFPTLARELVSLKPDVLVTSTDPAIAAVRRETRTIPIVMAFSTDPVATGFVASLAHPGGNVTGLSNIASEMSGKRLALLKDALPGLSHVALLWNPDVRGAVLEYKEAEAVARSLRVELQSVEVSSVADLDRAFEAMSSQRAQAFFLLPGNPIAFSKRLEIATFGQKRRLPSMFPTREYVDQGGLMSYGASLPAMYHRAGTYAGKILKGAKPADLPVEQPTKFELVINLKTAKAIGLTVPPSLLQRADQLIQ